MKYFLFLKRLFLVLCITTFSISCDKKETVDPKPKEPPIEKPDNATNGGDVYRYQMITVNVPSETLTKESYTAKLGDKTITLTRLDEKNLIFVPDENIPFGEQRLVIPELKDFAIKFEIKEQVLVNSPEKTLEPLLNKFQEVIDAGGTPGAEQAIANVKATKDAFTKANSNQRKIMAQTYMANKVFIDQLIQSSFSNRVQIARTSLPTLQNIGQKAAIGGNVHGTLSNQEKIDLINKHMTAILVMSVSAGGVAFALPWGWHTLVFLGATGVAAWCAIDAVVEIARLTFYYTAIELGITNTNRSQRETLSPGVKGNILGLNTLMASTPGTLDIVTGKDRIFALNMNTRSLQSGDRTGSSLLMKTLFEKTDELNGYLNKANNAINWVNSNLYAGFSIFKIPTFPNVGHVGQVQVGTNIFDKELKLSISHPNLKVNKLALSQSGSLLLNVETVNTTESTINAELKYAFKDDFTNFSGSVPIKVQNNISLVGTWKLRDYMDGTPVGVEIAKTNTLCANIPGLRFTLTGLVIFNSTSYWGYYKYDQYSYDNALINPETCELLRAGAFVHKPFQDDFTGTYTIREGDLRITKGNFYGENIFELIDENTLNIGGSIFVRSSTK